MTYRCYECKEIKFKEPKFKLEVYMDGDNENMWFCSTKCVKKLNIYNIGENK